MDEGFICECGNDVFWFFWNRVRCAGCHNEYMEKPVFHSMTIKIFPDTEKFMRRFNNETHEYSNWEKSKLTYKNV